MAHRSFFVGPCEVAFIKKGLPHHLISRSSTYELLTACLWKCHTIALEIEPDDAVHLSCMINTRGKQGLGVPHGYYGNTSVLLGYAVGLVKKAKEMVSEEYVRSSIDVLVLKGRPKYTTVWNYVVADATKVGLEEADFGWGKPAYGGVAGAFPLISFYVKYRTRKGLWCR
ncbi:alcohol acyltransferase 17-like [Eucalyptus grandis]|uniref:alcohol acyltransferase 17-like n=1 Tax=Eucalyptus grandis TaxID=71139 RepID=UPI00192E8B05|nr:alcohol acyltransferase 17-like [Eucalyptus grandis]